MQTLLVLDPGHFHAALTLREAHPLLAEDVHVYARLGAELEDFLRIVESFNARRASPTRWRLHVHTEGEPLERLIAERRGEVVVVAGRNDGKMAALHRLHQSGFHVLGDKPWIIGAEALPLLREVAAGGALAMDIMTERHEICTRLQRALMAEAEIFGEPRVELDGPPTLALESVHHLYKEVNGAPLRRPAWYFDVAVQGEGIVDVPTHLADLVQWMSGGGEPFDFDRDVNLISAQQWPTAVPREMFDRITGLEAFPPALHPQVREEALAYACNGAFAYRLRGIPVRIRAVWTLEIPPGGGDTHAATARGTLSELVIRQGPETGFLTRLFVRPRTGLGERPLAALAKALEEFAERREAEFPDLGVAPAEAGFEVIVPEALRTTHEQHFARVLDEFLRAVETGRVPPGLGAELVTKYTLLVRARELANSAGKG